MSVTVFDVAGESPAARAGIYAGDSLISINGNEIDDVLDYRFWQLSSRLVLRIAGKDGKERSVRIKKDEYEELGMLFETYLMDRQHTCKNNCLFCFVAQLPKGMRQSLYFKDDDSRLSFLFGNYVTLTNISEHEIERIIKMHISPINVSVHTTNPELRVKMMANPDAGRALSILHRFADAGISINCQLVLCPGINDGLELERSLGDLSCLSPALESIALVPVGITRHRDGLYPLSPYTKEQAGNVIDIADRFGNDFFLRFGSRLVYCSDEFYLKAGRTLPDYSYYEEFSQLENGVGLLRSFEREFNDCVEDYSDCGALLSVTVATGADAAPFIEKQLSLLAEKLSGLTFKVYAIENDFFGRTITVAGLVTATDIIAQLKGKDLGEALILPDVMLRHEKDRFLDDLTADDVSEALSIPVVISKADGDGLFETVTSMYEKKKEGK